MRKVLLAILTVILIMPTLACDSGSDGGGGATEAGTTTGLTITRTTAVYNRWINERGINVPYSSFGITNVSVGLGRALPEGVKVIVVTRPAHGTLSRKNTYYTPTSDYVGRDFFTFKVADSAGNVYPELCKIVFSSVDAEPPEYYGEIWFDISASNNTVFYSLHFSSPGGIESVKINSQSLTVTGSGTPAFLYTDCHGLGGDRYQIDFYGDFTGCSGNWVYDLNVSVSDAVGNVCNFYNVGMTELIH